MRSLGFLHEMIVADVRMPAFKSVFKGGPGGRQLGG